MALVQEKKGGPYTKDERDKRQKEVYRLYFELRYPAVKIAEMLIVHRNTINEDIKYLTFQIGSKFGVENIGSFLVKEIESLDIQRRSLVEELEKQDDIEKKLRIRKLLFDMSQKIIGFVLKIAEKNIEINRFNITHEVSEEEIKEFVMSMSVESRKKETKEGLLQRIITLKKCDIEYAESVFNTMRKLGLDLFVKDWMGTEYYNIASFASHRGYTMSN